MKIVWVLFLAAAFLFSSVFLSLADENAEKAWDDLQEQAITYYQSKEHQKAVDAQAEALKLAEKTFGPEDLRVAESLDNLAIYSQGIGDYAGAEKLYERAMAIMEKKLSPTDHYLAIFTDYVAEFYGRIGKKDKEKELRSRAKAIRARENEKN